MSEWRSQRAAQPSGPTGRGGDGIAWDSRPVCFPLKRTQGGEGGAEPAAAAARGTCCSLPGLAFRLRLAGHSSPLHPRLIHSTSIYWAPTTGPGSEPACLPARGAGSARCSRPTVVSKEMSVVAARRPALWPGPAGQGGLLCPSARAARDPDRLPAQATRTPPPASGPESAPLPRPSFSTSLGSLSGHSFIHFTDT